MNIAYELKVPEGQVLAMSLDDFHRWSAFLQIKAKAQRR